MLPAPYAARGWSEGDPDRQEYSLLPTRRVSVEGQPTEREFPMTFDERAERYAKVMRFGIKFRDYGIQYKRIRDLGIDGAIVSTARRRAYWMIFGVLASILAVILAAGYSSIWPLLPLVLAWLIAFAFFRREAGIRALAVLAKDVASGKADEITATKMQVAEWACGMQFDDKSRLEVVKSTEQITELAERLEGLYGCDMDQIPA